MWLKYNLTLINLDHVSRMHLYKNDVYHILIKENHHYSHQVARSKNPDYPMQVLYLIECALNDESIVFSVFDDPEYEKSKIIKHEKVV